MTQSSTKMSVVTVALISSLLLSWLPQTQAAYGPLNYACCVKYTRDPVPIGRIKGYIQQSSREVCRIDAIIFFTKNNKKVCASTKDKWVRDALASFSSKIKKITNPRSQQRLNIAATNTMPSTSSP